MRRCWSVLCAAVWMFSACGEPVEETSQPEEAAYAAQVEARGLVGSGVYLGDGILVTNWHLAISSAKLGAFNGLDPALFVRHFNAGDPDSEAALGQYYCSTDGGFELRDADPEALCEPVDLAQTHGYTLDVPAGASFRPARLLYANMELDLAIVEVDVADASGVDLGALEPLKLASEVPPSGARVNVLTYPGGGRLTSEACTVLSDTVEPLADPATEFPSILVVPSFTAECFTVAGGSSGGGAFDADGRLIGLVWTGDGRGAALFSAVAGWRAYLDNPERQTTDTQLEAVLAKFAAP